MLGRPPSNPTGSLVPHATGDCKTAAEFPPLVYETLRRIAGNLMRQERTDHTLQPTAVVHEAYLRLNRINRVTWNDRAHFCAMAARVMRRVLTEHARRRKAEIHGGKATRVTLAPELSLSNHDALEVLAVDQALERLAQHSKRAAHIAELKFFAGLLNREIALELKISERTVTNGWRFARSWLRRELSTQERSE